MRIILYFCFVGLFFCGCSSKQKNPKVDISYNVTPSYYETLNKVFPNLSDLERREDWGKEFFIGQEFIKDSDYYRAITALKRSIILMPKEIVQRKQQAQYDIILCYALAKKYPQLIAYFEKSTLAPLTKTFPNYTDLLIILYEAFTKVGNKKSANEILQLLEDQKQKEEVKLSSAIMEGDIEQASNIASQNPSYEYISTTMNKYETKRKSESQAQFLNAILPGAGYLYVGQNRSAITSFLLNGLFIAASYHFFHRGQIAAGIITSSLEVGWYVGGIFGAGKAARDYNNALYKKYANKILSQEKLFPLLMLHHSF